jgi:hypothetical protein
MSGMGLGRVKTFSCKRSELEEVATRAATARKGNRSAQKYHFFARKEVSVAIPTQLAWKLALIPDIPNL